MRKKEHIKRTYHISRNDIVISRNGSSKDKVATVMKPRKAPEPSLANQQELANRVMHTIKESSYQRTELKGILTTFRDILTCTDSFLIRGAAYAVAAIVVICLLGGAAAIVTSLASQAIAYHGDYSVLHPFEPSPSSPDSPVGKISYHRSMESFILSQS